MTAAAPPTPTAESATAVPYDPLRLCIFATIAVIALGTALATGWMSRTIVFRHLRALE